MTLSPPGLFPLVVARLRDHEMSELAPWLQVLEVDFESELALCAAQPPFALPRVLVGAERIFGPTSLRFDRDETSFCFPLLVAAKRSGRAFRYVALLEDFAGLVTMPFYRVQETPVRSPDDPIPAVAGELSRAEIVHFTRCFLTFLYETAATAERAIASFSRAVPCEQLVYGFRAGEWFHEEFDDPEAYERAAAEVADDLTDPRMLQERAELDALLEDIAGG